MPEGPEIRRAADALAHVLTGQIDAAHFACWDRASPIARRAHGGRGLFVRPTCQRP